MVQPDFVLGSALESCTPSIPLYRAFGLAPDGILQISVTAEPWLPERPSEACLWPECISWLSMAESSAEPTGMVLADSA